MKFRLSEEDAERLDCPRDVEFDSNKLMGREAIALDKMGWPLDRLGDLAGTPVVDADGKPKYQLDAAGHPVLVDGQPLQMHVFNPEAALVMIWIAVRRATGRAIDWDTFDINLVAAMESVDESPGKAPTNRASRRATKSTKQPSRTTSTSRRRTSTTG